MKAWLRILVSRVVDLFRGRRLDADLREELASHVEEAVREYMGRGVPPDESRRLALRDLGGLTATHELHRDARGWPGLDGLWRDVRYGLRSLRRSPAFTLSTFATIAICTGVLLTSFTLLHHVVLAPLPFDRSGQLVTIRHVVPGLGLSDAGVSPGLFQHYSRNSTTLAELGLFETRSTSLVTDAGTDRVIVTRSSVPARAMATNLRGRPRTIQQRATSPSTSATRPDTNCSRPWRSSGLSAAMSGAIAARPGSNSGQSAAIEAHTQSRHLRDAIPIRGGPKRMRTRPHLWANSRHRSSRRGCYATPAHAIPCEPELWLAAKLLDIAS